MKFLHDFSQHNEAKRSYKINQKDYGFYVFHTKTNKIVEGFEYQNDAKDRMKELLEESDKALKGELKVYTKRALKTKGFDPEDNGNWADATW